MRQYHTVRSLQDYAIKATDGELGRVDELYLDDASWTVRYFIVDTGTWLTGRTVLIAPGFIENLNEGNRYLVVNLTRKQVKTAPSIDSDRPVSRQYETSYYSHFGVRPYWEDNVFSSLNLMPAPVPRPPVWEGESPSSRENDPRLRSSAELTGYGIQARNGEIGHVQDFIVDDSEWRVPYLEVDTRSWWPGRKVLVATAWIRRIDWGDRRIRIDLDRSKIRTAPEYPRSGVIGPEYELKLFKHYGT